MAYKAALIILYDMQGKFLLQHRSKDAQILPGYWAFFGGGVKPEETEEEAVRREAREELNYHLKSPVLFAEQDFTIGKVSGRMYVYIEHFDAKHSNLKLCEGQDWGWFNSDEINTLQMIEHDRKLIESINNFIKNAHSQKT